MKVSDFRGKYLDGEYNVVLNKFNEAFDLNLIKYVVYNQENGRVLDIRDYYEINEKGQELLISLKEELIAFNKDYYKWKTTKDIALKINESPEYVFEFVKKRCSYQGFPAGDVELSFVEEENVFTTRTKVKKVSSYQILKDIQIHRRFNSLKE